MIKSLLTLVLMTASVSAFGYTAMVDGISDADVVQSVKFTGEPGYESTAAIVRNGEGMDLSLVIIQQSFNDIRNYLVVDNSSLGLTADGMYGTESTLEVAANGSLLIKQQNQAIGRDRWERTLTVAFRNGKYVIAGYTYSSYDTLQEYAPESCDYNLLAQKGVNANKSVKIKTGAIALEKAVDTEKWYTCKGW
jgi:hypothetical protein